MKRTAAFYEYKKAVKNIKDSFDKVLDTYIDIEDGFTEVTGRSGNSIITYRINVDGTVKEVVD